MALARVLETEVMDTQEEAHDYDAMDFAEVNGRFSADFLEACGRAARPIARVIDFGTGTAQIPITLCKRAENVSVTAVDMADHMLTLARRNVTRAGLDGRITLVKMDAKHTQWERAAFDAVMSNSIVHHIPNPTDAFTEWLRVIAPGGLLFVRDLARPATDADVKHIVATYSAIPDGLTGEERAMHERQRQLFDDSLRAALTADEIRAIVAPLGVPASAVQMTSDRHWTIVHVMPS